MVQVQDVFSGRITAEDRYEARKLALEAGSRISSVRTDPARVQANTRPILEWLLTAPGPGRRALAIRCQAARQHLVNLGFARADMPCLDQPELFIQAAGQYLELLDEQRQLITAIGAGEQA